MRKPWSISTLTVKYNNPAGLPKPPRAYPAMALGTSEATPLQVASAYTAFANLGTRSTPIPINRITTGEGVTIAAPTTQKNEVLRPDVAYVMNSFMKDVINRGTGAYANANGSCLLDNHIRQISFGVQEQSGTFTCAIAFGHRPAPASG